MYHFLLVICVFFRFFSLEAGTLKEQPKIQKNRQDFTFEDYLKFCREAAENDDVFATFRDNVVYKQFSGYCSREDGANLLDEFIGEDLNLERLGELLKKNDSVGNPRLFPYSIGHFSPLTIYYAKIAYDLKRKFGDLSDRHIVEIGGRHGGLCKSIADFLGFASYTIIGSPEENALAKKYLSLSNVNNVRFVERINPSELSSYDLLISDRARSVSIPTDDEVLLHNVVQVSKNGYLILEPTQKYAVLTSIEKILHVLFQSKSKGIVEKGHITKRNNPLIVTWCPSSSAPCQDSRKVSYRHTGNAITYSFSGGRLGDCFISYLHAKWLAYKYDLPFYYIPFEFSDQFCLSDFEQELNVSTKFSRQIKLLRESKISQYANTLFIVPFFAEYEMDDQKPKSKQDLVPFKVDWKDPTFRTEIIRCLALRNPLKLMELPKDCITVGVHVRRGEGIDPSAIWLRLPLKFPSDEYYIDQLKKVSEIFKGKKIYVFILSDVFDPIAIKDKYANAVNDPNMVFDCHAKNQDYHSNFLEDFSLLQQFDCLILCHSNFSLVASKLVDYNLLITPLHADTRNKSKPVIDEVEIIFKAE